MVIYLWMFKSGMVNLDFLLERGWANCNNWPAFKPFVDEFLQEQRDWDADAPGILREFKKALQWVLNSWTEEEISAFCSDLGFIPEPMKEFLIVVWEYLFPDEPWQRDYPPDLKVDRRPNLTQKDIRP